MAIGGDGKILELTNDLACKALTAWGVENDTPVLLKHRENAVFRVMLTGGKSAVLRVHRLNYHSDAALRSELQWMAYLRANGFPTPAPQLTTAGDYLAIVATPDLPEPRQVDCLSWVEGQPFGQSGVPLNFERTKAERLFFSLGRTVARMHELTSMWTLPNGFERHSWDFDGFFGPEPIWGTFADSRLLSADLRRQVSEARQKAMAELAMYGQNSRTFGLIHSDLVRENLLVSGEEIRVIDFDDSGFGWHMYDLAVALYQNQREPLYPVMRDSLLEGYQSVRALTEGDVRALPLFLSLRAFALIGWMQSRADNKTSQEMGAVISARGADVAVDYLHDKLR